MNWRRGLLRLWVVVSLCWLGVVGVAAYFAESNLDVTERCIERQKAKRADIAKCTDSGESRVNFFLLDVGPPTLGELARKWGWAALLPPIGLLLAGLAVTWIVTGFARDRRDKEAG